jgi:hypothetical protein
MQLLIMRLFYSFTGSVLCLLHCSCLRVKHEVPHPDETYHQINFYYMYNILGLRPKVWPYLALVEGCISTALHCMYD